MPRSPKNPLVTIYREEALDYFYRMGGAGRYQGFQEWHPALLTLGCALQATGKYSFDQLGFVWSRLPFEIVNRCDGLREKLTRLFIEWHQPFEMSVDNVRTGAEMLLQELSIGSRGNPLSDTEAVLLKRVEFEFDVAFRAVAGDLQAGGLDKT